MITLVRNRIRYEQIWRKQMFFSSFLELNSTCKLKKEINVKQFLCSWSVGYRLEKLKAQNSTKKNPCSVREFGMKTSHAFSIFLLKKRTPTESRVIARIFVGKIEAKLSFFRSLRKNFNLCPVK